MINAAAFELQVNRHMNATEWVINTAFTYWQNNADSYADMLGVFSSELSSDTRKAASAIKQIAVTLWTVLKLTIASANEQIDEFVEQRTDKTIKTKEVSWQEALTAAMFSDFVCPILNAWLIATIWESTFWIDINRRF